MSRPAEGPRRVVDDWTGLVLPNPAPDSARAAGIEYAALVQRIVDLRLRFEPSRLG